MQSHIQATATGTGKMLFQNSCLSLKLKILHSYQVSQSEQDTHNLEAAFHVPHNRQSYQRFVSLRLHLINDSTCSPKEYLVYNVLEPVLDTIFEHKNNFSVCHAVFATPTTNFDLKL